MLVCLENYENNYPVFTKFGGKVVHGIRKNPLDFGSNLDHVIAYWGYGYG